MKRPLSNVEWQAWGEPDPLFGVASLTGRNRKGEHPWTDAEFYALGAESWAQYSHQWERYGVKYESRRPFSYLWNPGFRDIEIHIFGTCRAASVRIFAPISLPESRFSENGFVYIRSSQDRSARGHANG